MAALSGARVNPTTRRMAAGTPRRFSGRCSVTGLTRRPCLIGPIDRQFSAYITSRSAPTLAPGDIFLDNLSSSPAVRRAIEAVGRNSGFCRNTVLTSIRRWRLIHQLTDLRKARCRTREVLWNTIGAAARL